MGPGNPHRSQVWVPLGYGYGSTFANTADPHLTHTGSKLISYDICIVMHVIPWTPHTYIYMAVKLKVEWIKQPSEPAELSFFQLQVFTMLMWSGASSSTMKQVPRMSKRERAVLEEQNQQSRKWKGDDKHLEAVMAKKTHTQDQTSSDGKDSMSPSQASTPSLQDI